MSKIKRADVFNLLSKLELNFNKSWRAFRKDFGREDSHYRYFEVSE
jgi:hypothetical protein